MLQCPFKGVTIMEGGLGDIEGGLLTCSSHQLPNLVGQNEQGKMPYLDQDVFISHAHPNQLTNGLGRREYFLWPLLVEYQCGEEELCDAEAH